MTTNIFSRSIAMLIILWLTRNVPAQSTQPRQDPFAEIGSLRADYLERKLVRSEPPQLPQRLLPTDDVGTAAAFQPAEKMTTSEQLRDELQRQREAHRLYLQDLAPALAPTRVRQEIDSFDWRTETEEDRADFTQTLAGKGAWQRVLIPHYGGPLGRAATYYRTTFDISPEMLRQGALFACFKGVDYKAHVFINGALVGSHEGIFAPFEFEFTPHARTGTNVLLIKVVNDFIMLGNSVKGFLDGDMFQGDKIYAAVGPGWDDPEVGWHACPPGMGIYQDVAIEARRRIHLHDIFVRSLPQEERAEAWIEVFGCNYQPQPVVLQLGLFGQNFSTTVFDRQTYSPTKTTSGSADKVDKTMNLTVGAGVNLFKIPLHIPQPRLWEPDTPWLYQLQVRVLDTKGKLLDTGKRQFGMRSFRMEYAIEPKGRMFLNGRGIKLRGANTMGALQQCVIRKDWDQLIDDILLAKITHMNYMRLTQTPVQPEVYDYCDRLGLMVQTDLPLFGCVRRNQFCETVRQAEEMERLVRSHPSNIMVTYINEPFPKARGNPNSNLTRDEMTRLFEAADGVVHMANPDRVTKAVDGDYDPPGPGLPDNHCYCGWYNGHGVELGMLHKGYWQRVKPGWVYGCGEFGTEGLDPPALMRKHYPKQWLPRNAEEEKEWSPSSIVGAQTGIKHAAFFETPQTLADWVDRSQAHQAWTTRLMTEAFRRDNRMHSFAIHLFVDAFPSSWMKAIIDYERQPKPAWFVYRDALTPLAANLRSDRRAFFSDEPVNLEAWVCNDRQEVPAGVTLHYQLEMEGKVLQAGTAPATIVPLASAFQGIVRFRTPLAATRGTMTIRLGLLDAGGKVLHDTAIILDIFPPSSLPLRRIYVVGKPDGKAAILARNLGAAPVFSGPFSPEDAILIDDMKAFGVVEKGIAQAVRQGARAVFLELPPGKHNIGGSEITVGGETTPTSLHFVSRATGHKLVEGFEPDDFKFWYDAAVDRPSPLLQARSLKAAGFEPILRSFDALAAGGKADGKGCWYVCQIALSGRIAGNPVAAIFAQRLLAK